MIAVTFELLYVNKSQSIITLVNVVEGSRKISTTNVRTSMNADKDSLNVALMPGVPIPLEAILANVWLDMWEMDSNAPTLESGRVWMIVENAVKMLFVRTEFANARLDSWGMVSTVLVSQ